MLDTIQDAGRYGNQQFGINPNGVMDLFGMKTSNILAGNDPESPVIELHFPASVFLFTQPALIAIAGADFSPHINGEPVPVLHPILVSKNDLLQFNKPVHGARTYLSIHGNMLIEKWLNSYSTNTRAGAGGFFGRSLQKDDEIVFDHHFSNEVVPQYKVLHWQADTRWMAEEENKNQLLVLKGNEWDQLDDRSKEFFQSGSFTISAHSDRMGYRFDSEPLSRETNEELVSTAVSFGTIQLLPGGQIIVLGADHQTTGGYPRIGHVISAHHSKLAQLNAGELIQFKVTDQRMAEELLFKQNQHLLLLENACSLRLDEFLSNGVGT